jgi:aspartate/methionine/tyrosine aminotransferase
MRLARRLHHLQSNVFADMDLAKQVARQQGQTMIDLSLGSSDLLPPAAAIAAIRAGLEDPSTYGYNLFQSTLDFRTACADWYTAKFQVTVDPETEVLPLIGSQEGTAHLPLALLNPGEGALLTDPGYPSHYGGVYLADGVVYSMPLRAEQGFLPELEQIPTAQLGNARMMVLSYPHNPTTATASLAFWQKAVQFCQDHDLVLVHDFPYADWVFEGEAAPSIFQVHPAKTNGIELFTLSKSFHMGGFRVGFAIGDRRVIRALRQVKATVDFNQYQGILRGAATALRGSHDFVHHSLRVYRQRRDACVAALAQIGWPVEKPKATMYLWAPLPQQYSGSSVQFCVDLVKATGVALAPGSGFGACGEGYVRFALVVEPPILQQAVEKIALFL